MNELKKKMLAQEIEDEVWRLFKRRGWLIAAIGVGGIWAAVLFTVQQVADQPLKELQKQLVHAEIQVENAKKSSAAAGSAADQVSKNLSTLQESIQTLGEQAKFVGAQFDLVRQQIDAASNNAALRSQRDFVAIQERITALEGLVKQIGEESAVTKKAAADYARKIAELEGKVEREQKRFAENSAYRIVVLSTPDKKALATEVQSRLASAGFRASITELATKIDVAGGNKNILTYHPKNEPKAQEIIGLLKPILKNIQATALTEPPAGAIWKAPADALGPFKGGFGLYAYPDPNSFAVLLHG